MVEENRLVELLVQVEAAGADTDEVDRLARDLLAELRELPVDAKIAAAGKAPKGAKAAELLTVGALVVSLLPRVLPSVVAFLQSWVKRGEGKNIKIKAADGKRSFTVDLPPGAFSHQELNELLATLGAGEPFGKHAAGAKGP